MKRILLRAVALFALCTAISAAAYVIFDMLGTAMHEPMLQRAWVLILPVYGSFVTYLVFNAVPALYRASRSAALMPLHGHYYAYHGQRVHVLEDDEHCRWVATAQVRRIVGQLAGDYALARKFPSGVQNLGPQDQAFLRDDALIAHLSEAHSAPAIQFKNWAERNIAFPARKTRARLGIVIGAPGAPRDDDQ